MKFKNHLSRQENKILKKKRATGQQKPVLNGYMAEETL